MLDVSLAEVLSSARYICSVSKSESNLNARYASVIFASTDSLSPYHSMVGVADRVLSSSLHGHNRSKLQPVPATFSTNPPPFDVATSGSG